MRLIDADKIDCLSLEAVVKSQAQDYIDSQPTIDAEPVVHAHWDKYADEDLEPYWKCSHCNRELSDNPFYYNRCPYCGAKIDEEAEE